MKADIGTDPRLYAYLIAFAATIFSVILDVSLEKSWKRDLENFGDFDLGLPVERWNHWGMSSRTVLFAAIVAGLVEAIFSDFKTVSTIILIFLCLALYCLFTQWSNRLLKDGHAHAVNTLVNCRETAEMRKKLFNQYYDVRDYPYGDKNQIVGGSRAVVASKIEDKLRNGGYKALTSHSVTLFMGSVVCWAALFVYLFYPVGPHNH